MKVMSLDNAIKEFIDDNKDEKVHDILSHFGEKQGADYPDEVYKAAAEVIVKKTHPLARIIKAASKGDVTTAANMIQDLDISNDVPILDEGIEKTWENYVEMATEMLK